MAKRIRRVKKHTTKPVGNAIKRKIKQLKSIRAGATAEEKKQIDLNIRALQSSYNSIVAACKDIWIVPR